MQHKLSVKVKMLNEMFRLVAPSVAFDGRRPQNENHLCRAATDACFHESNNYISYFTNEMFGQ